MNINIRLKDLKRMRDYLYSSEINYMLNAIIDYAEYGIEYDFSKDQELMIWEDIKPMLDKSRENYQKWLKEQMKEKEKEVKKPNYVGRVSDYYDELIKKGDDKE